MSLFSTSILNRISCSEHVAHAPECKRENEKQESDCSCLSDFLSVEFYFTVLPTINKNTNSIKKTPQKHRHMETKEESERSPFSS